jgi:fructose-specific phosphotransferase system IIC component
MTTPTIEQPVTESTDRQKARRDILAGAIGGAIATAATGVGIFPALGVGLVAGMLFTYLEWNKLTK